MQAPQSGNGKRARGPRGTLSRLLRNNAGNTMAIVGAALIPITAMIGSGLDMSRAYMAKSRLQSACDAASLAARRVMKNDDLSANVTETGQQFFDFNFPQGLYQTEQFEPAITKPAKGLIRIAAETRIPTTVMKLFGFSTLPLEVSCEASLNFVNTDVVLVLDVTGSMKDPVKGSGDSTPKIQALREAVMALYDELEPVQEQLNEQGLRLRYGIVPYSSTVNVGKLLYAEDPDYITSNTPYQSRVANMNQAEHVANTPTASSGWEIYNGTRTSSQCSTWVTASSANGGGPAPTATTVTSYRGSSGSSAYSASTNWGWSGAATTSGTSRSCRRWRTVTTTTYATRYKFGTWSYREQALDTASFKAGGTLTLATDANGTMPSSGTYNLLELVASGSGTTTTRWNGCIEERQTVSGITASSSLAIPDGASDLDINGIPSDDASRWRPMLPQAIYRRASGTTVTNPIWNPGASTVARAANTNWQMNYAEGDGYYACPVEAHRLDEWESGELETYLASLQPIGGTYHDIGMIWGARLISTGGVFGDACEDFNGMPCNRHVIFMTDGQQTAYCNVYSAYGVERNDKRVMNANNCTSDNYDTNTGKPTDTATAELLSRHERRFRMICNATRDMTVTVWVVAFDTALNSSLRSCADNDGQAFVSNNKADLIEKFREIGNQIGALRLTK